MIGNIVKSLPMMVCLFWTIVLWLDWREQHDKAKLHLALFSMTATLLYMGHSVYFSREYKWLPMTDTIYCMANLAVFPLYYIYIKELTGSRRNCHWLKALLIPSLLMGMATGVIYAAMSREEISLFTHKWLYHQHEETASTLIMAQIVARIIIKTVFAIEVVTLLIIGYREISKYDRMIENTYANTEERSMRNVKTILSFFIVASIVSFIANIIGRDRFCDSPLLLGIPSLTFSALLFALLYIGHKRINTDTIETQNATDSIETISTTEDTIETTTTPTEQKEKNELPEGLKKLLSEVKRLIDEEKLFQRSDLRINDVAAALNTNRYYIQRVINEGMKMTFSEFINRKRIDYITKQLKDNPDTDNTSLWMNAGFSSESSFFRNFKLFTGMTPKEFIRRNMDKK